MRSTFIMAVLVSAAVTARAAPSFPADKPPFADYMIQAQLDTADAAAQRDDSELVLLSLSPAISPKLYGQLSPATQHHVAQLYGVAALNLGKLDAAYHAFVLATATPNAGMVDWYQRLLAASLKDDAAGSWRAFKTLRERWPEFVSGLSVGVALNLDAQFASLKTADARFALGETLLQQDWHSPDPAEDSSNVWLPYAAALADQGRTDDVIAVARRITNPTTVIKMRVDKRFDAAVARAPDLFDPVQRGTVWLGAMQKLSDKTPHRLETKIALGSAFHNVGRNEEALQVLNEAAARKTGCRGDHYFDDYCAEALSARWLKGEVLISLGRTDEGLAEHLSMLDGAQERNGLVALQTAAELNVAGRADEALTILNAAQQDAPTADWQEARAEIRACTVANMGRPKAMAHDLALLKAHRADAPVQFALAELCANDLNAAAATYIAMLKSPSERLDALGELQDFSDTGLAPYSRILRSRMQEMRSRPDVEAVLTSVGHVLKFDLARN
jgi:tetratricopeptide (TPR) repeat protein